MRVPAAAGSIFLSAFLLFLLEPLIAKRILPWFGGSSAVWSVCLVFYQVALLAGYCYAQLLNRLRSQTRQIAIHVSLLVLALFLLPIGPTARWQPGPGSPPAWQILEMLTATIGLPFLILSATSPLLQAWLARSGHAAPYRLFALSNFASLAALLAYPLAIEPNFDSTQQSLYWSAGFVLFALICTSFTLSTRRVRITPEEQHGEPAPTSRKLYWIALSACASMLLLSITNQIDENVAAVPLLWVLPLAVYLISFIVAFSSAGLYPRSWWPRVLAFGLAVVAYAAYDIAAVLPMQISIPVYLAGLLIACIFCQGELYQLRPPKGQLTGFYLAIAAGGALGAIFVGLIAPQIFGGIYELPVSLTFTAALALLSNWESGWGARVLWAGVTVCMAAVLVLNWQAYTQNSLALKRSFYGSLRVVQSPRAGPDQIRTLFHGTVQHGAEFLEPARQMLPTTYYAPDSGIGIVLNDWPAGAKRVGIVGLGAGTLAAYGQPGDAFTFYEINPQVIQLAWEYFYFLRKSKAAIEIVPGDARLSIQRANVQPYDVMVLDAFSGDAIPVHLLTKEAMSLYVHRLTPMGVMAFHVSNNFLDLEPVVRQLAQAFGYPCITVRNHADADGHVLASEWVLVTKNTSLLQNEALRVHAVAPSHRIGLRMWTDGYNSLLPILKTPQVR